MLIEIATTDYESTRAAIAGGADRMELCTALGEGGLTPSAATIRLCRKHFPQAVIFPIIRPRSGDFYYTATEKEVMLADIDFCREHGCKGIVTGALLADGNIDVAFIEDAVHHAGPMQITFHRAFDRCRNPEEALEQIIAAGCTRILTSGQRTTAPEGTSLIKTLIKQAAGRIIIMPGSGVRPENVKALVQETGAAEIHASMKSVQASHMQFIHPHFSIEDYQRPGILAEDVQALRDALLS